MHERTRKLLCRLTFVLCCALPTLLTVAGVIGHRTPWYHAYVVSQIEQRLTAQFGMRMEIDQYEMIAPGAFRITGVRVLEPETQAEVVRVRMVEWIERDGMTGLRIHQPEVQSVQLPHAWRLVHDRFLCQPHLTEHPVRIVTSDLSIHSAAGSATLTDLDLEVRPGPQRTELVAQFHLAGHPSEQPASVSAIRQRDGVLPRTVWNLRSGQVALPCSTLAEYLPWMQMLGAEATFAGNLQWHVADDRWQVDLSGSRFENVQLASWFNQPKQQIVGKANVEFTRCRIEQSQLVDLAGTLEIDGPGRMGQELVATACQQLGLQQVSAGEVLPGGDIVFDRLAIAFDLQQSWFHLAGLLPPLPEGRGSVIASSAGQPLLVKPSDDRPVPMMTVAQILSPSDSLISPFSARNFFRAPADPGAAPRGWLR